MIAGLEELLGAPVTLQELKHKPGRRRTLRARGSRRSAIVKIYQSARAPLVSERIAALAIGPDEPAVPEVLHVDPARRTLVLSDQVGRPFREILFDGDLAAGRRVGAALGRWHAAWSGNAPECFRPHTFERERDVLLSSTRLASPPLAGRITSLLDSLELEWTASTVVHRDLYEEQILVGERVALIDLDDASSGPAELDVGNLLGHAELLELRSGRSLRPMLRELLRGYRSECPTLDEDLTDACRELTLLRLACLNDSTDLAERAARLGAAA
jgi:Ser/Thr protein kinase RdoA (MazF antagonist)